ncbi:MAG: hypothetical protein ACRC8Y_04675 [Chroococcales cyanobacterium]
MSGTRGFRTHPGCMGWLSWGHLRWGEIFPRASKKEGDRHPQI